MRVSCLFAAAAALALTSSSFAAGMLLPETDELQRATLDAQTGEISFDGKPSSGVSVAPGPIFSAIPGPYSGFAAANYLGFDDYDSIADYATEPVVNLSSLRFVGGVTTAGQSLDFNFYLTGGVVPVAGFSSTFGTAGNFIWTISNINIDIPSDGELELVGSTAADTGRWFLATAEPTLGTQSDAIGGAAGGFSHRFELSVPEPVSASLLALGLPLMTRRRKA